MKVKKFTITTVFVITLGLVFFATFKFVMQQGIKKQIIASGKFHQVAHQGEGNVMIYRLLTGERVLELSEFSTGEGENLEVLLIGARDALENETVESAETFSLGRLKSVTGHQSFAIPDSLDLNKFGAVTIWSKKYKVNFTTAPLHND
ncbi:MAG: DM13 domain-containing protein [Acidobacteriota bacterium]